MGTHNTGIGINTLLTNTIGLQNTAVGGAVLSNNIIGSFNTGIGYQALYSTTTDNNTAVGYQALYSTTTGTNNTAVGFRACNTNTTGSNNICIGYNVQVATTTGSKQLNIGDQIVANWSTTGSEVMGLLRNTAGTPGTTALVVGTSATNGNGASLSAAGTWTNASDARIKEKIHPLAYGLDSVLALKPVSYVMKGTRVPQIGFIAQEVETVIPEVVSHPQNLETEHYGLSYGNMVAVTVKAIQEQEQTIRTQQATINLLADKVRQLEQRLGRSGEAAH